MDVNRRHLIGASAAGAASAVAMSPDGARAAQLTSAFGRDASQYGVRPGSPEDQTKILQRAIDEAARAQVPLALPPGVYRTGMLRLQNGTQLVGVRGATKLVFNGGTSVLCSGGAGSIGNSIWLENVSGDVSGNIITGTAATAIVSFDAQGLIVSRNSILGTNDNGIEILRTAAGEDGTLSTD